MSRYDLIAFDMDGTLLDSKKELLPSTIKAVEEASRAGKQVVVATGRAIAETQMISRQLPSVRYIIGMNGAMVRDMWEDRVIYHKPIDHDTLKALFDLAATRDLYIQLMSVQSIIQKDKHEHIRDYHMDQYKKLFDETAMFVDNQRTYWEQNNPDLYKFSPYSRTLEGLHELIPYLKALPVETARSEATGMECSARGTTKGVALRALCEYLSVPAERVIAVGDSENDLSMLEFAGFPVAMENAIDRVKAIAAMVTDHHDHDGCARVIYERLLSDA